jgi:hypothetical protein
MTAAAAAAVRLFLLLPGLGPVERKIQHSTARDKTKWWTVANEVSMAFAEQPRREWPDGRQSHKAHEG